MVENDHGNVVDFLGIGHGEEPAFTRPHPDGLIIHRPVEDVLIARLLEEIGRKVAGIDAGAEPSLRLLALVSLDRGRDVGDQLCLAGLVEIVLVLGVRSPVADDLVAALAKRATTSGQ